MGSGAVISQAVVVTVLSGAEGGVISLFVLKLKLYIKKKNYCYRYFRKRPVSWSSGQSFCLLIMRSRVRFPVLPWEFSLKGRIPAVTMVWVG